MKECTYVLNRFSHVQLFVTLWSVAHWTPLWDFSRQDHWSGWLFPSPPGNLPDPGIEPLSLMYPALAGRFFTTSATKVKVVQLSPTLCDPRDIQSMEFSRPEYWSGQPFPSQRIFPTQGSNPGLPHCRRILYQLSHEGSPVPRRSREQYRHTF